MLLTAEANTYCAEAARSKGSQADIGHGRHRCSLAYVPEAFGICPTSPARLHGFSVRMCQAGTGCALARRWRRGKSNGDNTAGFRADDAA